MKNGKEAPEFNEKFGKSGGIKGKGGDDGFKKGPKGAKLKGKGGKRSK
jgi:hypothetical protein